MSTVVTGSCGMVGSALVKALCDAGENVIGIDNLERGRTEFHDPRARLVCHDLSYGFPLELAGEANAIFHLAARVGGVNYMQQQQWLNLKNSAIDWSVIEVAMRKRIPLTYMSTACVYPVREQAESVQGVSGRYLREDEALKDGAEPESIYGWAKLLGELTVAQAVREDHSLPFKICRGFNVYGPREVPDPVTGHVVPALIFKALCADPPLEVWGTGRARRSLLYVDDAAAGIMRVMRYGVAGEPYNLGTDHIATVEEIATRVLSRIAARFEFDLREPLRGLIEFNETMPEGVFGRGPIIRKARDIGWAPAHDLTTGIAETLDWCVDWLVEHGQLPRHGLRDMLIQKWARPVHASVAVTGVAAGAVGGV